jgi:hypothetical protein
MKVGKSLSQLAAEIERQQETKRDLIASTKNIGLMQDAKAGGVVAVVGNTANTFGINGLAHDQIGAHTGIPSKYYDKMLAEAPDLLANNVNRWFEKYPAPRLIRTLDNKVRAFLSDQYRPLENADLAEAVLPILLDMKLEIMSCEITERRLYIKAVDERIKKDVPSGRKIGDGSHVFFDTCSPALIISNSEVGSGTLSVESGIFTKVCTNLATIAGQGMKRRHVGTRNALTDEEQVRHLLTDQTKRATDKAIWMQVRDVVKGAFDEARFTQHISKVSGMAKDRIESDDVVKVVELSSKTFGFTESEGKSVLKHLIAGGDLTRYGLFNAVTRTAQDIESYDRASEFETMGGKIIELPKNDWQRLAKAA